MPQLCTVCHHGDHVKIDRELRQKRSLETLSRKYDLSISALKRHGKNHNNQAAPPAIPGTPLNVDAFDVAFEKWHERRKMDSPETVLKFASVQLYRLELLADEAQRNGDSRAAIAGIAATLKTTSDLFAKYFGMISDGPKIDQSKSVTLVLANMSEEELRELVRRTITPTALESTGV